MADINKIILPNGQECNIAVQTQNINGILPLEKGGTNASDLETAKINLGIKDDIIQAYPIEEAVQLSANWLSKNNDGIALTPERGVIYILLRGTNDNNYLINTQFRWNGSSYVKISNSQASSNVESISNIEIQQICV